MAAKTRDADRILADRLRRLQTDETKSEHKRETRRRIIIGAIVRAAQESQTDISHGWLEEQIRAQKRPAAPSSVSMRSRPPTPPTRTSRAAGPDHRSAEEAVGQAGRGESPARAGARQGEGDLADRPDARPRRRAGAAR